MKGWANAMAKVEPGMEGMVDMYLFETGTLLDQLDEILLRTEQANEFTDDDINEIFRIMHTVKGSSAMMGFENLQKLAHKGEDMFFIIREDPAKMKDIGFVYDIVFQMSDLFKAEIEEIRSNDDYDPTDFSEMIEKLEKGALVLKGELDSAESDDASAEDAVAEDIPVDTTPEGFLDIPDGCVTIRVFFEQDCKMENLRAFLLINRIREEYEVKSFVPDDVETNSGCCQQLQEEGFLITVDAELEGAVTKLIEESVNLDSYEVMRGMSKKAEPVKEAAAQAEAAPQKAEEVKEEAPAAAKPAAAKAPAAPASATPSAQASTGKQSLISVNLAKLDQLHDIVGEIITTESMVISNPELEGLNLESFSKAARELRKLTDELQDTVMSIRMVPLTGSFQKMNRIVRDMRIKLNKDVDLVIEGDQTEVDKSIVDNLNDPLMHLVRNCMDHGIEKNVEDRVAAGKPEKGTITLSAMNASGEIIITIADDGAGINTEKVLAKAEAQGLLTKPASEYSDREINSMILLPGFSTNSEVTEFSGRGVGMDVVKKNIEKSGGSLSLESVRGKGTTFIIKIPLTLAIIDGMEIKVGDTIFTVPISTIKQSMKVTQEQILTDTNGNEMIMLRGTCYPIIRMREKFEMSTGETDIEKGILMLVESDGKSVCLFADRLIGEQQIVVKPFPQYVAQYDLKSRGLSGCSIMGDGTISLIVDVNNVIKKQ